MFCFTSNPIMKRYGHNPVLSRADVPYKAALVFNAGVVKYQGKYVMVFRNDYGSYEKQTLQGTNIGLATSDDGLRWTVAPKPCFTLEDGEILRAYDPRLTVIDGRVHMCFAVDTRHGVLGGIAVTDDFAHFTIKSTTLPNNRNMALFPERIGGEYVRLERPMPYYGRGKNDMWTSRSSDLVYWGRHSLLMDVEAVAFANEKIGPAAPPVRTEKGWLTTFHAVHYDETRGKNGWEPFWKKVYTAGIMLLDLEDPTKIVGKAQAPLLVPEADYETKEGYRTNVVFPGGMILEDSGEVKLYYGAADTVECLATADVNDLIAACLQA